MITDKAAKEAFVTGLKGTSSFETLAVIILPLVVNTALAPPFASSTGLTLQYAIIILPSLLFVTVLADWVMAAATIFSAYILLTANTRTSRRPPKSLATISTIIGQFRGLLLLLTALSILGVDFQAFPRRFAKCETFGVSLMDAGVGAFIFAAGLVSRRARGAQSQSRASITIGGLTKPVAMICVGLIKYAVHSSIEYQNHVSEYGLHWNFFFTFGIVTMVSALRPVRINECFTLAGRPVPVTALTDLVLGVALAVGYHVTLTTFGLEDFVLNSPRDPSSFFSANREGVLGLIGYLSIHSLGAALGAFVFSQSADDSPTRNMSAITVFGGFAVVFWAVFLAVGGDAVTSRRLVNAPYIVWACALSLSALTVSAITLEGFGCPPSAALNHYSRNGLIVFIVANLLTGVVNFSFNTLQQGPASAVAILLVYITVVSIFACRGT